MILVSLFHFANIYVFCDMTILFVELKLFLHQIGINVRSAFRK